jgi:hypothetical protein
MKYKFYVKKVTKRESSFSSRYDLNKDMYLICIEDEKEFNNLIELLSYLEEQTLKLTGVHQPVYQVRYYDEILHRYQYAELLFDSRLFNITVYSNHYEKSFLYDVQDEIYKKYITIILPAFKHNKIEEIEKELRKNILFANNTMFYELYDTIYNFTEVKDV